jgi:hypothetical protein
MAWQGFPRNFPARIGCVRADSAELVCAMVSRLLGGQQIPYFAAICSARRERERARQVESLVVGPWS